MSKIKEIFNRIDILTVLIMISVLILLLTAGIHYLRTGEKDSIYEQAAEQLIEHNTGLVIDFSD